MSDKPILFSGPMVRAILDGSKTQTRRVLKPTEAAFEAPKFRRGDRLWVRETWQGLSFGDYIPTKSHVCDLRYAATDPLRDSDKDVRGYPWCPSIHMPRWASRLTLIVEDVRVQRLQDITEADAMAEGGIAESGEAPCGEGYCDAFWVNHGQEHGNSFDSARDSFRDLWNSINGPEAWDANPWVAAYTFRAIRANIDSPEASDAAA